MNREQKGAPDDLQLSFEFLSAGCADVAEQLTPSCLRAVPTATIYQLPVASARRFSDTSEAAAIERLLERAKALPW
jgi:hypothetical protein